MGKKDYKKELGNFHSVHTKEVMYRQESHLMTKELSNFILLFSKDIDEVKVARIKVKDLFFLKLNRTVLVQL